MKKKILTIACCATLLSISSVASAQGLYVSGKLGLAIANDSDISDPDLSAAYPGAGVSIEYDSGLALAGAIGTGFSNNVRIEIELAYQKNDLDKITANVSIPGVGSGSGSLGLDGDVSSIAGLLNGYYDFKNTSAFTPFISGGIGMANVEFDAYGSSDDDTVFAYQVGLGIGYAINEKVSLDLKYRYFGTADLEFDTTEVEYSSHNIYAGVRIGF